MKKMIRSLVVLSLLVAGALVEIANSQEFNYDNPLIRQRADPWIHRTDCGIYYFIATVPEYDRIEIRKSNTINGLAEAEPVVVWRKHDSGPMSHHIWAPELHRVDGKWYIYFAAARAENIWKIRMWALSNDSDDPTTGEWVEEGQIRTERDDFALDATVFEHKGNYYYVWAEKTRPDNNSGLIMSKMKDGVTLIGPEVVISEPEYEWEMHTYAVNEGAAVIKHGNRIFMTFSASATDHTYAIGLLWAYKDSDLMDPNSWHKLPEPVFYTNEKFNRFGPGHNSFTVAEDGKTPVLVYHAREYKEIDGFALDDPNRDTRVRTFRWNDDGFPDFAQEIGD
ncbi:glycoside hydrolase family 43 protein [Natronoflexus pectinivorans]|uniref:GH43 family beta-xylosidase n=1 Tax=Natronoflexus pectinivorans TaxID=682526 RepID=A0A4R2GH38_9BACT|nr:glycoside hydrolase family 43 protein [Natronoflexus pectinivorans]TCO07464.1 GH43 family beta-xylosidase [Natronoflexus pectinivorans]